MSRKQKRMTRLSSHVWAEEVSNASNQPSSTWFISKWSWKRLRCSLASWRDWRLLSLRALLNFSPLARYIRTQVILWVHSLECLELSIMLGDAQMFYTTGKGCLWVWGNLTATNHIVLRLTLSLHESCNTSWPTQRLNWQTRLTDPLYVNVFIPFEVREDDVWVASFPKCGTTWTQVILTNHENSK